MAGGKLNPRQWTLRRVLPGQSALPFFLAELGNRSRSALRGQLQYRVPIGQWHALEPLAIVNAADDLKSFALIAGGLHETSVRLGQVLQPDIIAFDNYPQSLLGREVGLV